MATFKVTKGRIDRPFAVVLYGVEGVGKTTFAVKAPGCALIDLEHGSHRNDDVPNRVEGVESFADLLECIDYCAGELGAKTIAIDSLDVVETFIWQATCREHGKRTIEEFGYGKGYVLALGKWEQLTTKLRAVGRNVILIGHAIIKGTKTPDPDLTGWDHYQLNLHDKAALDLKAWCDALLFADYEYRGGKVADKAIVRSTGERIMRTTHDARWDAKNRYNLPATLPLSWEAFAEHALDNVAQQEELRGKILELIPTLEEERGTKILAWLDAPRTSKQLKEAIERIQSK